MNIQSDDVHLRALPPNGKTHKQHTPPWDAASEETVNDSVKYRKKNYLIQTEWAVCTLYLLRGGLAVGGVVSVVD